MNALWTLLAGAACAAVGGELFVRGAVGLARWMRVAPGIIAATVVAFATSSPELSVSINAALAGDPRIALGDALGSNIVNLGLVLGLSLLIAGMPSPREQVRRDFPVSLFIPVLTSLLFLDGTLSHLDGVLLLAVFSAWLVATAREARRTRGEAVGVLGARHRLTIALSCVAGLALLVAAGRLIVTGGLGLANAFGIDAFVVGTTIVAVGTSVPELATAVIARLRGHDDISLGTILGSNIFNGLFVVGVAASIHPISVDWREVALALAFGFVVLVAAYPARGGYLERWRGALLLALYAAYVSLIART